LHFKITPFYYFKFILKYIIDLKRILLQVVSLLLFIIWVEQPFHPPPPSGTSGVVFVLIFVREITFYSKCSVTSRCAWDVFIVFIMFFFSRILEIRLFNVQCSFRLVTFTSIPWGLLNIINVFVLSFSLFKYFDRNVWRRMLYISIYIYEHMLILFLSRWNNFSLYFSLNVNQYFV